MRILRLVARHTQRELADHQSIHGLGDEATTQRRKQLEQSAIRTRAHVTDAQERRRVSWKP